MRSFKWAVAALALSGLTGCFDSEPQLYRVALSARPDALAGSCYQGGSAPTTIGDQRTNVVSEASWVLWEGVEDVVYLDLGITTLRADMADAPDLEIPVDAIEGKKNDDGQYVFTVERTERKANATIVTAATITIEELGQTLEGSVAYRSSCTGTGCDPALSCDWSRRVVGRRVDGERFISVGDTN